MEKNPTSAEELKTIRKIMEESTKFLSLSGLSGLFLGIYAIAGAIIAYVLIPDNLNIQNDEYFRSLYQVNPNVLWQLIVLAVSVLALSLATGFWFSYRKGKRSGKSFWTPVSRRLFISLLIPLATGGIFVVILLIQDHVQLIVPVFLIFYGLALINAAKFTYNELFYFGIIEIISGLVAAFIPAQGIFFWIWGFGILHIVYGLFMYRKYEA